MKKATLYHDDLIERLKDREYSIAYLNECLNDDDPRLFLNALRNVLEARGGLALADERADLSIEDLLKLLSDDDNSDFNIIYKDVVSLELRFVVSEKEELR